MSRQRAASTEQTPPTAATRTGPAAGYWGTARVAEHYLVAEATVRYWRHIGYGPRGVRLGRRVLYPVAEIARFDAELSGVTAA